MECPEINFSNKLHNPSTKSTTSCSKCRLCLVSQDTTIGIFSSQAMQMGIHLKLSGFCHLNVSDRDEAPTSICFTCLNEVNRFCDFYKRVQDNQKLLAIACRLVDFEETVKQSVPIVAGPSAQVTERNDKKLEDDCIESVKREVLGKDEPDENDEDEDMKEDHLSDYQSEVDNEEVLNNSRDDLEIVSEYGDAQEKLEIDESEEMNTVFVVTYPVDAEQSTDNQNEQLDVADSTDDRELGSSTENETAPKKHISRKRIALDEPIRQFFDLKCSKCSQKFLTFAALKRHMTQAHDEQCHFVCCNRKLYRRDTVMEHINFHLNPKKFTCNICNQICKSKITLKVHLKQHIPQEDRRFNCEKCGMRFVLSSQLKSHMTRHLSADEKKFVCEECGKAFGFRFVLEKHKLNMHLKQKNFMCEICARSFVDKVNLTAHKRVHDTSLPRLECPKCNALLKTKKTLQIHMRVHDPSNFPCTLCDRVFPTKNGLVNHIQYCHSGKEYPCPVCGRNFKKSLNLQEHMARHTGDILYKCEYCDKNFNAKANRYAHVKKTHPTEWEEKQKLKWRRKETEEAIS